MSTPERDPITTFCDVNFISEIRLKKCGVRCDESFAYDNQTRGFKLLIPDIGSLNLLSVVGHQGTGKYPLPKYFYCYHKFSYLWVDFVITSLFSFLSLSLSLSLSPSPSLSLSFSFFSLSLSLSV